MASRPAPRSTTLPSRPHPLRARRGGICDVAFPGAWVVLRVEEIGHVFHACLGVAEAPILHFPRHAVVSKISFRIKPSTGIQSTDFQTGPAKGFDRHAAPGAGSDHNRVIDLFWHESSYDFEGA